MSTEHAHEGYSRFNLGNLYSTDISHRIIVKEDRSGQQFQQIHNLPGVSEFFSKSLAICDFFCQLLQLRSDAQIQTQTTC